MASELRIKTQNAIDALREANSSCSLAMLIDGDTGLVLSKSSDQVIPQNELDDLAAQTKGRRKNALASAMIELSSNPDFLSWTDMQEKSITTVISPIQNSDDKLVCQFDAQPDRSALFDSARAIFELSSDAEAA